MMILATVIVLCGIAVGVIAVLRGASRAPRRLEANAFEPRFTAQVGKGTEQIVLHLARTLGIALNADDAGYGHLYVQGSSETDMRFATRSEIGRGFKATLTAHRARQGTLVEYYLLALPGDDAVFARLLQFEQQIIQSLRELDPSAVVHEPVPVDTTERQRAVFGRSISSS